MSADQQLFQMFILEMEKAKNTWVDFIAQLSTDPSADQKKAIYKKIFLSTHNLKAASQMCQLAELGNFFHKLEDVIAGFSKGKVASDTGIPEILSLAHALLERWFLHVKLKTVAAPDCSELYRRVELFMAQRNGVVAPRVETVILQNTEAMISDSMQAVETEPSFRAETALVDLQPTAKEARKASRKHNTDEKILIGSAALDEMIHLIGGLSVDFEILMHHLRENYQLHRREDASLHTIGQTILWLKENCLQIRMQPAQILLNNLEKAALDIAGKLKKPIQVQRDGDDILLDKSVLEGLFDILVHVVRNAVDHGIEDFKVRQERDKDLIAKLSLSVADVGGHAVIHIRDDGGGIDPKKIFKKAVEKGIIEPNSQMTDEQIIELIFVPEFSTAQAVSEFSGRGVGMDIVRSAIQSMGGTVHVKSKVGEGTVFKIVVPTQMSLIEAFVVTIHQQRYAVPKQDLLEIIDLTDGQTEVKGYKKTTAIRTGNRMTPAVSLRQWFGYQSPREGDLLPSGRPPDCVALVLRQDDLPFAFLVDEVRGLQQVFVRPVPDNMSNLPAVSGAAVFSDGEPGLILNLPTLINSAQGAA